MGVRLLITKTVKVMIFSPAGELLAPVAAEAMEEGPVSDDVGATAGDSDDSLQQSSVPPPTFQYPQQTFAKYSLLLFPGGQANQSPFFSQGQHCPVLFSHVFPCILTGVFMPAGVQCLLLLS